MSERKPKITPEQRLNLVVSILSRGVMRLTAESLKTSAQEAAPEPCLPYEGMKATKTNFYIERGVEHDSCETLIHPSL